MRASFSPLSDIAKVTVGAIVRRLSGVELRKEQFIRDLIFSFDQLCAVKVRSGDIPGALTAYEEMIEYQENVANAGS